MAKIFGNWLRYMGHTVARVGIELPAPAAPVKNSTAGCVLVQAVSAASGWTQLFAVLFTFC